MGYMRGRGLEIEEWRTLIFRLGPSGFSEDHHMQFDLSSLTAER